MHTKTMEGLTGASMNMKMLNTPFRVYKEAEQRGDTGVMERAMGYVGEFADKAGEYQKKAENGMKEDAEEAREKARSEQEEAIRKHREKREELEKRIEKSRNGDIVSISESGKAVLDEKTDAVLAGTDSSLSVEETADAIKMEPVIYTKTGESDRTESGTNISLSI